MICDGRGRWCRAWLDAEPEPSGPVFVVARPAPSLAVGFALIKGDRPELVIQKLTELDIDVVAPFVAQHSVVRWDDAKSPRRSEPAAEPARAAEPRGGVINDVFADADDDEDSLFDGDDDFDVPSFLK